MIDLTSALRQQNTDAALQDTLLAIARCCREISRRMRTASIAGIQGSAGQGNAQGEEQQQMDVIANELLKQALQSVPAVRGLASEEEDHAVATRDEGSCLVAFDPLDGSSNIAINGPVGTIFSLLPAPDGAVTDEAFLQPGTRQL